MHPPLSFETLRLRSWSMNITIVCEGLTSKSIVAQPWKHVFEIAKRMMKKGNEIQIITDQASDLCSEEIIDGVKVLRIEKGLFSFEKNPILEILNDDAVDAINWHGSDVWSVLRFSRLGKSIRKNIVWTLHSGVLSLDDVKNLSFSDYYQLYKFWNNILSAAVPKRIVRKWTNFPSLHRIITLSKRTAKKLSAYGLKQEISYIPSGVDIQAFKPSGHVVDNPIILYFGPISSLRGLDTLLSSFKLVKKQIPESKLMILARETAHNKSKFRKIAAIAGVELVTDILTQNILVEKLKEAAVIVLPFKFWPQVECPLTVLEAMSVGKTVITTSIGAIPEIITDSENGVLVPAKNSKKLADGIARLLRDKNERERIGRNARAYVEEFYDWDIIVNQTLDILKS